MEKNKVLLTDKVTKENIKSPTFKRWVMRVLCFACILSLALQLAMCVAPLHSYAADDGSSVGTWVLNEVLTASETDLTLTNIVGKFYGVRVNSTTSSLSDIIEYDIAKINLRTVDPIFEVRDSTSTSTYTQTYYNSSSNTWRSRRYVNSSSNGAYTGDKSVLRTIIITGGTDANNQIFINWLEANATKVVTQVYDFTGEYRIFKPTLSILFTDTAVVQSYNFDFNVYGGYNADYLIINSQADRVTMSYSFTDEGSGGLRMVYRQGFDDDTGTWLVPRARVIYFQSNPDDPTFQQWLLDNTYLVAPDTIDVLYDFGYQNGYNDGWTNNVIGDTLNAPLQALNNMVLLQTTDVTVTMGGVIVAMISLSILIVFLKKYAGG